MDLSGLNKMFHSLYAKKLSKMDQSVTKTEIASSVNTILDRILDSDPDKVMMFREVNADMISAISSSRFEVFAILKSLDNMVEVVDAVKDGYSRLELTDRGPQPIPIYDRPWYGYVDIDGFIEPPAVHHQLKKLGTQVIQDFHSRHMLGNVCLGQDDLNSWKFRFELNTKLSGTVTIYVIPSLEISTRPRCIRTDIPIILQEHKILLSTHYLCGLLSDYHWRTLWHVTLISIENALFANIDMDGGMRYAVRDILHFLCEKYVHFPVTRKTVDALLEWSFSEHADCCDWLEDKFALRVLEVLENLRRALRNHRVRSFHIPGFNLLEGIDGLVLDKSAERLQHLITRLRDNPYFLQQFVS